MQASKYIATAAGICLLLVAVGIGAARNSSPKYSALNKYISQLLDNTFTILHDPNLTLPEKTARSESLLEANLDLNWMALYTLGRNRRILLPEQVQRYSEVYKRYIIETYGAAVKLYDGQRVTIQQVMPIDDTEYSVATLFVNENSGQEISVEYRVRLMKDNSYKVFDIVTEGISLVQSQHSEFNSVMANHGLDKLIEILDIKANKADARGKQPA